MRKFFMSVVSVFAVGLLSLLQVSCSDPNDSEDSGRESMSSIGIAVATIADDYSAANFEIISAENHTISKNLIPGLHTDLVIRAHGSDVYILERIGRDNVIKYSAGGIDYQEKIGMGLNIQDIAIVSATKAYISCYEDTNLVVFNPATGKRTSTISLARFNTYAGTDSAEAYPFAGALAVRGDYVYVACQRLKTVPSDWGANFVPADTSLIAVIDTRTNQITDSVKLNKKNPASMDVFQNRLLVSSSGDWYDPATGGVEMIDLTNNTNLGVKVDGSAFGGSVTNVVFISLDKAYINKTGADRSTEVVPFNPTAGTVGAKVDGIVDGFGGLAYGGSKLYAGERGAAKNGVVVINPNTNVVDRIIETEMPPSSLAIIRAD